MRVVCGGLFAVCALIAPPAGVLAGRGCGRATIVNTSCAGPFRCHDRRVRAVPFTVLAQGSLISAPSGRVTQACRRSATKPALSYSLSAPSVRVGIIRRRWSPGNGDGPCRGRRGVRHRQRLGSGWPDDRPRPPTPPSHQWRDRVSIHRHVPKKQSITPAPARISRTAERRDR